MRLFCNKKATYTVLIWITLIILLLIVVSVFIVQKLSPMFGS